ncbi:MAG: hypothetical protein KIT27_03460 [Legionellales bacterium]|nr:hypothetical protein [Legionellales bacterium]
MWKILIVGVIVSQLNACYYLGYASGKAVQLSGEGTRMVVTAAPAMLVHPV